MNGQTPRLDVHIRTQADTAGAQQAERALDGVNKAATRSAKDAQQAARGVNELGENFEKGAAAGRILGQALSGNLLALTQLAPAIKVISTLMKTSLIGAVVALGAAAAQIVVPFVSGFKKKREAIESATSSLDTLKLKLGEVEDEAKRSLDAQIAKVVALRESYSGLVSDIDKAEQRIAKANELEVRRQKAQLDLQEQQALAVAKTDEERAQISAGFNRRRELLGDDAAQLTLENQLLNAGVREDAARQAQSVAAARIREAQGIAAERTRERGVADSAFQAAMRDLGANLAERQKLGDSLRTKEQAARAAELENERAGLESRANEASQQRTVAIAAEEAALDNVRTVTIEANQVISSAQQQIDQVAATRTSVPIEQEILGTQRAAREVGLSAASAAQARQLREQAQAAMEAGDFAAQDRAVAGLRALGNQPAARGVTPGEGDTRGVQQAAKQQGEALAEQGRLIIEGFNGTTQIIKNTNRELQKQQTAAKNSRP